MNLNNTVWLKLAPSKIHGVGVFAIRDIPMGQKLYCHPRKAEIYKGLDGILPEIKQIIVQQYPLAEIEDDYFRSPNDEVNFLSYMNHSDKPNYDHVNDVALHNIKKGQEITERYPEEVKRLLLDRI